MNETNDNLYGSEETPHIWYTSVPNMVDVYCDLDPYAFRLYCHIRRRIGEADGGSGACWESTTELVKTCKMSAGSVSKAKQTLLAAGLIRIEYRKDKTKSYHHITMIDIWQDNLEAFARYQTEKAAEKEAKKGSLSSNEQPRSPSERPRSPGETKKNHVKKNHEKKEDTGDFLSVFDSGEKEESPTEDPAEKKKAATRKALEANARNGVANDNTRAREWRGAPQDDYDLCKRAADLFCSGKLRWQKDDVNKDLATAYQLLRDYDGDARAAKGMIDRYYDSLDDGDPGYTVSGLFSLRNALPAFAAKEKQGASKTGDRTETRNGKKVTVLRQ